MKRRILPVLLLAALLFWQPKAARAVLELYSSIPPFVTQSLPPNVMLLVDNSTSMTRFAYFDGWNTSQSTDDVWGTSEFYPCLAFNPATKYYGYFNPESWYGYDSNHFVPTALKTSRTKGVTEWDGNFLNWLTMRRTDVLRKVLVGGVFSSGGDLVGQSPIGTTDTAGAYKAIWVESAANYIDSTVLVSQIVGHYPMIEFSVWKQGQTSAITGYRGCTYGSETGTENHWRALTCNIQAYVGSQGTGLIQDVGDRVRWGLTYYDSDNVDGGSVRASISSISMSAMLNEIQNTAPDVLRTPLAEALWSVTGYFGQQDRMPGFSGGPGPNYSNSYTVNSNDDPLNYGTGGQTNYGWCGKNFVIMITDGEPCGDGNLPTGLADWAEGRSEYNCSSPGDIDTPCYITPCPQLGSVPGVEDVALYAHTNDLREDLDSTQNLDLYVVYAFGNGSQLLRYAAINGGFNDLNGDGTPDSAEEWDEDEDGVPDNYYEAHDGYRLEEALKQAITDILRKVASGTSISVLATSQTGEGSIFQAFFRPSLTEGIREVTWLGYLNALWVDQFGNLREDTNQDHRLVYQSDKIVEVGMGSSGETEVKLYSDNNGDGNRDSSTPDSTIPLNRLKPIWRAGERLALTDPADRTIKTFLDRDSDGVVDTGEYVDFKDQTAGDFRPYLRAVSNEESTNIINFIRGVQVPGYRDRQLTVDNQAGCVWKLGDIVYSTPTVVGKPESNFNFLYGDESYVAYYEKYKTRDVVVYVGANDGMLHAFWSGKYQDGNDEETSGSVEHGYYSTESNLAQHLGDELWAYVPHNLLPHLKWLTETGYSHVYYVDQKPRAADVKMFTADTNHPNGWGTILIGGMRLGGGTIDVTDDFGSGSQTKTFRSAYFAFDVTAPGSPRLLWEFTHPSLGFTTSYPAIAKINDHYFLVFGSGPTDYSGNSTQPGRLFVIDLATGGRQVTRIFDCDSNAVLSDPITVDAKMDYNTGVGYVTENYTYNSTAYGKVYRLWTKANDAYSENPANWRLSTLFTTPAGQPITSGPASSFDDARNLWVYFGTGKYMCPEDKFDTHLQSFYGVKDPCYDPDHPMGSLETCDPPCSFARGNLFNSSPVDVTLNNGNVTVSGAAGDVTNWNSLVHAVDATAGWYIDFFADGTDPSERMISKPGVLGGIVFFTTFTPNSDICGFGGNGSLYGLNYITGTANSLPVFGTEADGTALRSVDLGFGVPSRVSIHMGQEESGATGYVQLSTGAVESISITLPPQMRPGVISWREVR